MTEAVVAVTVVSLIAMVLMGVCNIIENKQRDIKHTYFLLLIATVCMALSFELVSYYHEGTTGNDVLLCIVNYFDFILGIWMTICFMKYYGERVKPGNAFTRCTKIFVCFAAVLSAVCAAGTVTGHLFTFRKGEFITGEIYTVCMLLCTVPAVFMFYMLIKYRKTAGRHDTIVTFIYLLIPIIGMAAQLIFEKYTFTYICASFSILIIYAMLQTGEANASKLRHKLMLEFSRTDALTGLQNRAAYKEDLKRYRMMQQGGIVYCDMNKLKYINDHFGHESGDAQILIFVDMLKRFFGMENIYRLSGDEFAIVLGEVKESEFETLSGEFRDEVEVSSEAASVGIAYGDFSKFDNLVSEAERMMYKAKEKYHKANPQFARF